MWRRQAWRLSLVTVLVISVRLPVFAVSNWVFTALALRDPSLGTWLAVLSRLVSLLADAAATTGLFQASLDASCGQPIQAAKVVRSVATAPRVLVAQFLFSELNRSVMLTLGLQTELKWVFAVLALCEFAIVLLALPICAFVLPEMLLTRVGFFEAARTARRVTKGQTLRVLVLLALAMLFAASGVLVVVGLVVTVPLAAVFVVTVYLALRQHVDLTAPSTR